MRTVALLLLGSATLFAQPLIYSGGIVNAAAFIPASLPGGAIAQGSVFSIFGTGLGPLPGVQPSSFPLDTTLGGVSVLLQHQSSGAALPAIPVFVSDSQINAILPSSMPVGLVLVSVTYNGRTGGGGTIRVVRSSFGVFTANNAGTGPAIAQNFLSPAVQPLNSPANSAAPGQAIILWGTGLGPITGRDDVAPTTGNLNEPVELSLAGRPVSLDYRGRSGCCAGVDQINFRLPPDAPTGCAVPISVKVQNGVYTNIATIAVGTSGQPCADAWNLSGGARRWGEIALVRTVSDTGAAAGTADTASALFGAGDVPARFPPPGSCTSALPVSPRRLDAGPQLSLTGPEGQRQIPRESAGSYTFTAPGASPFLGPGAYALSSAGGSDVGPLTASLNVSIPLVWSTVTGTRLRGMTWTWTGGDPLTELAVLSAPGFLCTAPVGSGSLTVPPAVFADLPAQATINLGSLSGSVFTTQGLDQAVLRYTYWTSRSILFGDPGLPASPVVLPNGQRILSELATTEPERERGLMQRAELPPDRGMLFLYNGLNFYAFWMFNTLVPLDIIWMDQNRRIVFISANTPPCLGADSSKCPIYGGQQRSQYILEIAAGQAAANGLKVGDQLSW